MTPLRWERKSRLALQRLQLFPQRLCRLLRLTRARGASGTCRNEGINLRTSPNGFPKMGFVCWFIFLNFPWPSQSARKGWLKSGRTPSWVRLQGTRTELCLTWNKKQRCQMRKNCSGSVHENKHILPWQLKVAEWSTLTL